MKRRAALLLSSLAMALMSACSPAALLNATLPGNGYELATTADYGPDARLKLDVYRPTTGHGPAPVIVFFYGGSWKSGQRGTYRFIAQAYASRGYVVVIPDYRLYPQVTFPAFMDDAARAVDWVAGNIAGYGGDPARIVLMGHSAGAHMAALLALDGGYLAAHGRDPAALRGVIGLAGPYWFNPLDYRSTRAVFAGTRDIDRARPITFARRDAPPMLLLHGDSDSTVYPLNTERLTARLRAAGAAAESRLYPGTGHIGLVLALTPLFRGNSPALADTLDFLDSRTR